jgi:hypothetical protein
LARLPRNPRLTPDPARKPPFLPILGYVLGFMAVLGMLAFVVAVLIRLFG